MSVGGGGSPASAVKHIAASCHWSLSAVGTHAPLAHSGGHGVHRRSGVNPGGISGAGTAHCQPSSQRRPVGETHTVSFESAPCAAPVSCRYESADPAARSTWSTQGISSAPSRASRAPTVSPAIQRRR